MSAPHPRPDPVAEEAVIFWDFVAEGELRIQRCARCGKYRHPPRPVCSECGSTEVEWALASGRGEVWAYTVIHGPTLPSFASRVPYGAVVVRLDEGVFMVGNVVDCAPDDLVVGMPVKVTITDVEEGLRLPLFRASR